MRIRKSNSALPQINLTRAGLNDQSAQTGIDAPISESRPSWPQNANLNNFLFVFEIVSPG